MYRLPGSNKTENLHSGLFICLSIITVGEIKQIPTTMLPEYL